MGASLVPEGMDGPWAGAQGGSAWLEAPTASPCGMGAHPWGCQWLWGQQKEQDEALGVTEDQHREFTSRAPSQVSLAVPPTSREEKKKGYFLLIALEGRFLVCSDFWEHRVQAQIRGSNYAEKNTQL